MKKFTFLALIVALCLPLMTNAGNLGKQLKGRILLQVEQNGEAWYVHPDSQQRYFMGRPADAFQLMRDLGLGISERDYNYFNGYAPSSLAGKILLRVEANGEAYYVNPLDRKMHYLGRPADAFDVMRNLGLGITDNDLDDIVKNVESAEVLDSPAAVVPDSLDNGSETSTPESSGSDFFEDNSDAFTELLDELLGVLDQLDPAETETNTTTTTPTETTTPTTSTSNVGSVVGYVDIDYAEDLACDDTTCFVFAKERGVVSVDITNPTAPVILNTYDTPGVAWNGVLKGSNLYVADGTGGAIKLSVVDPSAPRALWTYTTANIPDIRSISTQYSKIYLGGGNGINGAFEALENSDTAPTLVGTVDIVGESLISMDCYSTTCYAGGGEGSLEIIDVTTPSAPTITKEFYNAGPAGHEPWGLGVSVVDGIVYFSDWGAGLLALDLSGNELSSVQTGDGIYDAAVTYNATIDGVNYYRLIVAANSHGGLALINGDNSYAIELIKTIDVTPSGELADGPHGVVIEGDYAFVADNVAQGLSVVKISE